MTQIEIPQREERLQHGIRDNREAIVRQIDGMQFVQFREAILWYFDDFIVRNIQHFQSGHVGQRHLMRELEHLFSLRWIQGTPTYRRQIGECIVREQEIRRIAEFVECVLGECIDLIV